MKKEVVLLLIGIVLAPAVMGSCLFMDGSIMRSPYSNSEISCTQPTSQYSSCELGTYEGNNFWSLNQCAITCTAGSATILCDQDDCKTILTNCVGTSFPEREEGLTCSNEKTVTSAVNPTMPYDDDGDGLANYADPDCLDSSTTVSTTTQLVTFTTTLSTQLDFTNNPTSTNGGVGPGHSEELTLAIPSEDIDEDYTCGSFTASSQSVTCDVTLFDTLNPGIYSYQVLNSQDHEIESGTFEVPLNCEETCNSQTCSNECKAAELGSNELLTKEITVSNGKVFFSGNVWARAEVCALSKSNTWTESDAKTACDSNAPETLILHSSVTTTTLSENISSYEGNITIPLNDNQAYPAILVKYPGVQGIEYQLYTETSVQCDFNVCSEKDNCGRANSNYQENKICSETDCSAKDPICENNFVKKPISTAQSICSGYQCIPQNTCDDYTQTSTHCEECEPGETCTNSTTGETKSNSTYGWCEGTCISPVGTDSCPIEKICIAEQTECLVGSTEINGQQCCTQPCTAIPLSSTEQAVDECSLTDSPYCSDESHLRTCIKSEGRNIYQDQLCQEGCDSNTNSCSVTKVIPQCVDDDGENYYVKSSAYVTGSGKKYDDVCLNPNELTEYICNDGSVESVNHICENTCNQGKCIRNQSITNTTAERINFALNTLSSFNVNEGDTFELEEKFLQVFEGTETEKTDLKYALFHGVDEIGNNGAYEIAYTKTIPNTPIREDVSAVITYGEQTFSKQIRLVISNSNRMPEYLGKTQFNLNEGEPFIEELEITQDPDGDDLILNLNSDLLVLPTFNLNGTTLSWTNPTYGTTGQYNVTLIISDGLETYTQLIQLQVQPATLFSNVAGTEGKGLFLKDSIAKLPNEKEVQIDSADVLTYLENDFDKQIEKEKQEGEFDLWNPELQESFNIKKKKEKDEFVQAQIKKFEETKKHIIVKKASAIDKKQNKTIISVRIIPDRVMNDVKIYEYIPKKVAESASQLVFSTQPTSLPTIIENDPLVMWQFETLEAEVQLTYAVQGQLEEPETKTAPIAQEITLEEIKKPTSLLKLFLPLLLMPLVAGILIYFSHFKPKK